MIRIEKNMVVAFRYVMKDGLGQVVEDHSADRPVRYLHGSGAILPVLQDHLEGLGKGESRSVVLLKPEGAGAADFFLDVSVENIRPATESEIFLGYPLEEKIAGCSGDCECHKE